MAWVVGIAVALVLLYLAAEAALHARRLRRIRIRIHVNGTRGKTTVTRRVAAALRQAGIRTVGKVTGDAPRLILPDGTERPIRRRGPARIQEQMWLVRQAAAGQAEAIVVECMALAPDLQRVAEERMIRSTLGVITNVRPDHFEVMGDDLDAVAAALAGTIPRRGVLVTADRTYFARFAGWAAAKETRTVLAGGVDVADGPLAPADEHAAIVAAVCAELKLMPPPRVAGVSPCHRPRTSSPMRNPHGDVVGSPRAGALAERGQARGAMADGMAEAGAPPFVWRWEHRGQRMFFVNAFSANDPVSTALLQRSVTANVALPRPRVALLNNRADRPRRMLAFAAALRGDGDFAAIALAGDLAHIAGRKLRRPGRTVWALQAVRPAEIVEEIGRRIGGAEFTLVGMGNAKGLGLEFARFFAENGSPCP
jgi:hypothetical protein